VTTMILKIIRYPPVAALDARQMTQCRIQRTLPHEHNRDDHDHNDSFSSILTRFLPIPQCLRGHLPGYLWSAGGVAVAGVA
jgi:hypothetical protein